MLIVKIRELKEIAGKDIRRSWDDDKYTFSEYSEHYYTPESEKNTFQNYNTIFEASPDQLSSSPCLHSQPSPTTP